MLEPTIDSTPEYEDLLDSLKRTIHAAQLRAAQQVNSTVIELYWDIGHQILERQQQRGWGKRVIKHLSTDLRKAHPGAKGYSERNLQYMATMAAAWPDANCAAAAAQLAWGHIMVILDRCPDRVTRDFYVQRAVEQGWTRGVLETMIAGCLHQREGGKHTTFERTVPEHERESVQQLVKDPYILEFLDSGASGAERELRKALVANLVRFLQELGSGFAFLGTEYHVEVGGQDFYIDLLFYHVRLHRYVVFELKVGPFQPEFLGKLGFYVQVVDGEIRDPTRDEPTLGILLVAGRNDVVVEYSLRSMDTPLAVSELKRLPEEVRRELPSTEALSRAVTETLRDADPGEQEQSSY